MLPLSRLTVLSVAAVTTSVALADASATDFSMKPVRTIHARVQADAPAWDPDHAAFTSSFGKSFEEKYRATLDSVNTASVEGALMYVQAEGINANEQSVKCERKNKMQYVVFYDLQIAQPTNAMAVYGKPSQALPEYCPFVALDGGKCTPEGPDKLPVACDQILGLNGQPNTGACIGGETRATDPRAPYPDTVWFSLPNSCLTKIWKEKTDECRAEQPGGLCPFGTTPDGVSCTYSYSILGYVSIDDVVGITAIPKKTDPAATYANFTEFCQDGGVEFKASKSNQVEEALPFWENPTDPNANSKRAQQLVKVYNQKLGENMKPLPSVKQLAGANPPCYVNTPVCASAPLGCRRKLYSQICEVCKEQGADCVTKHSGFKFPELTVDKSFKMTPGQPKPAVVSPVPQSSPDVDLASTSSSKGSDNAASASEAPKGGSGGALSLSPSPSPSKSDAPSPSKAEEQPDDSRPVGEANAGSGSNMSAVPSPSSSVSSPPMSRRPRTPLPPSEPHPGQEPVDKSSPAPSDSLSHKSQRPRPTMPTEPTPSSNATSAGASNAGPGSNVGAVPSPSPSVSTPPISHRPRTSLPPAEPQPGQEPVDAVSPPPSHTRPQKSQRSRPPTPTEPTPSSKPVEPVESVEPGEPSSLPPLASKSPRPRPVAPTPVVPANAGDRGVDEPVPPATVSPMKPRPNPASSFDYNAGTVSPNPGEDLVPTTATKTPRSGGKPVSINFSELDASTPPGDSPSIEITASPSAVAAFGDVHIAPRTPATASGNAAVSALSMDGLAISAATNTATISVGTLAGAVIMAVAGYW